MAEQKQLKIRNQINFQCLDYEKINQDGLKICPANAHYKKKWNVNDKRIHSLTIKQILTGEIHGDELVIDGQRIIHLIEIYATIQKIEKVNESSKWLRINYTFNDLTDKINAHKYINKYTTLKKECNFYLQLKFSLKNVLKIKKNFKLKKNFNLKKKFKLKFIFIMYT